MELECNSISLDRHVRLRPYIQLVPSSSRTWLMNALQWKWQCNTKHDNLRIANSVVVRITQIQNMGGNYCSQLQINKQIIFDSPFSVILKYQVALRQILGFFLQFKTSHFSSPNLPDRYSDCYDATVLAKTITLFQKFSFESIILVLPVVYFNS